MNNMKHAISILALLMAAAANAREIHVRPDGPIRTLAEAQRKARKSKATVVVHGGTYYLPETLVLTAEDSGVTWQAKEGEAPVISGGMKLDLHWETYKGGIIQAKVPEDLVTEELFVNGQRQILARYPNYDPQAKYFDGFAPDALSRERMPAGPIPRAATFMPCTRPCGAGSPGG